MALPTLSLLLSSQEARDAAPCVAHVDGNWHLSREGRFQRYHDFATLSSWKATGEFAPELGRHAGDCIWSGDLPALLAAMVAENEARRMHPPTEADQDGHPYWVCWTDSVGTWYDKAYFENGFWWLPNVTTTVTPDRVMRLPMGGN